MKRRGTPEADLQRAVVTALRFALPKGAIIHHCANEVTEAGPRGAKRQAILTGMGIHPGFADLMILCEGRVLFPAAASRLSLWRVTKSSISPNAVLLRVLTSTKTNVLPCLAIRSTSALRYRQFCSRMAYPFSSKKRRAICSPAAPVSCCLAMTDQA